MYLLLAEFYYIMEDLFLLFRNLTFVSFGNSYFCTLAIMRINRENTIGLVIDMQEKLIPTIINHQGIINNTVILLKGLKKFQSPIVVTQQNTNGLDNRNRRTKSIGVFPILIYRKNEIQLLSRTCLHSGTESYW